MAMVTVHSLCAEYPQHNSGKHEGVYSDSSQFTANRALTLITPRDSSYHAAHFDEPLRTSVYSATVGLLMLAAVG